MNEGVGDTGVVRASGHALEPLAITTGVRRRCGALMAFGQPTGSPASAKQVKELLVLLEAAGHSDFRDARGPMGFTQRQAGGKFTRDEAQAFIDQLEEEAANAEPAPPPSRPPPPSRTPPRTPAPTPPLTAGSVLRRVSNDQLIAEMRRRGLM